MFQTLGTTGIPLDPREFRHRTTGSSLRTTGSGSGSTGLSLRSAGLGLGSTGLSLRSTGLRLRSAGSRLRTAGFASSEHGVASRHRRAQFPQRPRALRTGSTGHRSARQHRHHPRTSSPASGDMVHMSGSMVATVCQHRPHRPATSGPHRQQGQRRPPAWVTRPAAWVTPRRSPRI
jgi:hypothetical protein